MKKLLAVFLTLLFYGNACAVTMEELYDVIPDPASCNEGVLKEAEKQKVLKKLNVIRKLHGLKPVAYNSADDKLTAKSALIMQSNAKLTHNPDNSMKCWTAEGQKGSGKSNLFIWCASGTEYVSDSESYVTGWLIDDGVESLGHRRWLIDPFLKHVSFGRVDGKPVVSSDCETTTGAAISVIHNESADIKDTKIEFVAYPYQNYSNELFKKDWLLSFTAIYDKSRVWNNSEANYAGAKITVTDEAGKALSVHSVSHDNTGYGVPNIIQWKVTGLKDNIKYTVKISGVMVKGQLQDYMYWFKLSDTPPEKLVAMETVETKANEPTETPVTENKPAECGTLFKSDATHKFYVASRQNKVSSGYFQITAIKNEYIEFRAVENKQDAVPLYAAVKEKQLTLINPAMQQVIHGTCYTDGVYGKFNDYYFYIGPRDDVTLQDIQKQIPDQK